MIWCAVLESCFLQKLLWETITCTNIFNNTSVSLSVRHLSRRVICWSVLQHDFLHERYSSLGLEWWFIVLFIMILYNRNWLKHNIFTCIYYNWFYFNNVMDSISVSDANSNMALILNRLIHQWMVIKIKYTRSSLCLSLVADQHYGLAVRSVGTNQSICPHEGLLVHSHLVVWHAWCNAPIHRILI